jgi:hypothetical protein
LYETVEVGNPGSWQRVVVDRVVMA